MTQNPDSIVEKTAIALKRLPQDLALHVVMSCLSNDPTKLARAIDIAITVNLLRLRPQGKLVQDPVDIIMDAIRSEPSLGALPETELPEEEK